MPGPAVVREELRELRPQGPLGAGVRPTRQRRRPDLLAGGRRSWNAANVGPSSTIAWSSCSTRPSSSASGTSCPVSRSTAAWISRSVRLAVEVADDPVEAVDRDQDGIGRRPRAGLRAPRSSALGARSRCAERRRSLGRSSDAMPAFLGRGTRAGPATPCADRPHDVIVREGPRTVKARPPAVFREGPRFREQGGRRAVTGSAAAARGDADAGSGHAGGAAS